VSFGRFRIGVEGSNPTRGKDVRSCFSVVRSIV
jgi:hypothetical protein